MEKTSNHAPPKAHEGRNKTQRLLCLLLENPTTQLWTVRSISEQLGLSSHDVGRILSRLALKGRVSRRKNHEEPHAYFCYFLNEKQRQAVQFLLANKAGTIRASSASAPTHYNEAELDALAQLGVQALVGAAEIKEEKGRLTDLIHQKQTHLQTLKKEVRLLKAREKRLDQQRIRWQSDLDALTQELGQETLFTLVELTNYLNLLLNREVFRDDARIKQIHQHYQNTVTRLRSVNERR